MIKNLMLWFLKKSQPTGTSKPVEKSRMCQPFLSPWLLSSHFGTIVVLSFLLPHAVRASEELRETIDSFFIRQGIFQLDTESGDQILLNENSTDPYAAANLQKLFRFIKSENAVELLDPKKIIVIYANEFLNEVHSFAVNENYQSTTTRSQIPQDLPSFLNFEKVKMQSFLNQKRTQVQKIEFRTAQSNKDFAKGTTLATENLIIYGLTENIFLKMNQIINKYLEKYRLEKIGFYFYGSRVMPRAEVIRRDPERFSHWGVYDDGVLKNSIRTAGITSVSDLDLIITVFEPFRKSTEVYDIGAEIQKELNQVIKNFPISLWITPSRTENKAQAFKKFKRDRKGFASEFQIIDTETVVMPKSCSWLLM